MSKNINVALIGNPNTGKTSVFNQLTGLKQKVGNYPGITVEKKEGVCKLPRGVKAHILDLPGTYSLNTTSLDESLVVELLLNKNDKDYPDVAVVISDVENLKRNLLLFTQIKDLKIPTILVINMADRMIRKGISLDIEAMEKKLDTKIALVSTRKNTGIDRVKELIADYKNISSKPLLDPNRISPEYFDRLQKAFPQEDLYKLWLVITQDVNFMPIEKKRIQDATDFSTKSKDELKKLQHKETVLRYQLINTILKKTYKVDFLAVVIYIGMAYSYGDQYIPMDSLKDGVWVLEKEIGDEVGIQTGDKIIAVDGEELKTFNSVFIELINGNNITIERDGQRIEKEIPVDFISTMIEDEDKIRFLSFRVPFWVNKVPKTSHNKTAGFQPSDKFLTINGEEAVYRDQVMDMLEKKQG
jgi:small GTP-binding protein